MTTEAYPTKDKSEMSRQTKFDISRRDVLIGGAALVAVTELPISTLPVNSSLRAIQFRGEKTREKLR